MADQAVAVIYQPGKDNPADYMSGHPLPWSKGPNQTCTAEKYVNYIMQQSTPKTLSLAEIKEETVKDATLQTAIQLQRSGRWHDAKTSENGDESIEVLAKFDSEDGEWSEEEEEDDYQYFDDIDKVPDYIPSATIRTVSTILGQNIETYGVITPEEEVYGHAMSVGVEDEADDMTSFPDEIKVNHSEDNAASCTRKPPSACTLNGMAHSDQELRDEWIGFRQQQVYCRWNGCTKTIQRAFLRPHEDSCDHREVSCECGHKTTNLDLEKHRDTDCTTHRIKCPVGCGMTIRRVTRAIHVTQECSHTAVMCPVTDCKFVGRFETLEKHASARALAHVRLLQQHNATLNMRVATSLMKATDAKLEYGKVNAVRFTIPDLKKKTAEGTTIVTSPEFRAFHGKWQTAVKKELRDGWHIYLCLVSMAIPLHVKVMYV
ncbi:TRAF3 [Branchiostoma lanceolatum]|uniref:TRAF3 protein n=1 Tax=Branchiostoma lanceolatum TaxID=7740 RepID=A0A8K0E5N4_BRALA|nr:TRAF3 [Branchiostoma lanceolatum]